MKRLLQLVKVFVAKQRELGIERSDAWGVAMVVSLRPKLVLDVGCGDGGRLAQLTDSCVVHGIEGSPEVRLKAEANGLIVSSFDLNGRWAYADNMFDVVYGNQVIEHLHNCRLFAAEALRVLKPGGTVVVATENLSSFLNCGALLMGYTPFSLMQTCGRYLGNPLGLHYGEAHEENAVPMDHPAYSGIGGHIRVLTVRQAKELFELVGFEQVRSRSISMLPLPDSWSQWLENYIVNRGHYLVLHASKPK